MVTIFSNYIKKLERNLPVIREKKIYAILEKHSDTVVDLNTGQLFDGKDSKGEMLASYRSEKYAGFKLTLNPKGVTDLKLEGNFWAGIFINSKFFPLTTYSKDEKTDKLVKQYGKDIFNLSPKSNEYLAEDVKQEVIEYYKGVLSI